MIEIVNRQRRHKIDDEVWRRFAERVCRAIYPTGRDATIVFVSDASIRKLNRQFRGKDYPTDVLSFTAHPEKFETENQSNIGEVVISVERAAAQAKQNGLSLTNEIQQLMLHGLLHLAGYDHETDNGEMNRLELKLRKRLRI
jgi:probable rRNA maturation factor